MKRTHLRLGPLLPALLLAMPALAQAPGHHAHHPSVEEAREEFIARARAGSAKYRDRGAAIVDGYRLLGPDFPGMGEHWVNPGLLLDGRFDAAEPAVLAYATIQGRPTLVGVAYARALAPGEAPPPFPSYGWHDHTGSIDEESVLLNHVASGHGLDSGMRIAMLHAWLWLDNPEGIFASDNWALPFARLGFETPAAFATEAARTLSLASGSDRYYLMLVRALARPSAAEEAVARELLSSYRARVEEWLASLAPGERSLTSEQIAELATIWTQMWKEIDHRMSTVSAARLRPIWKPGAVR